MNKAMFQQNFAYGMKFKFCIIFHMPQNVFSLDCFQPYNNVKIILSSCYEKIGSRTDVAHKL